MKFITLFLVSITLLTGCAKSPPKPELDPIAVQRAFNLVAARLAIVDTRLANVEKQYKK